MGEEVESCSPTVRRVCLVPDFTGRSFGLAVSPGRSSWPTPRERLGSVAVYHQAMRNAPCASFVASPRSRRVRNSRLPMRQDDSSRRISTLEQIHTADSLPEPPSSGRQRVARAQSRQFIAPRPFLPHETERTGSWRQPRLCRNESTSVLAPERGRDPVASRGTSQWAGGNAEAGTTTTCRGSLRESDHSSHTRRGNSALDSEAARASEDNGTREGVLCGFCGRLRDVASWLGLRPHLVQPTRDPEATPPYVQRVPIPAQLHSPWQRRRRRRSKHQPSQQARLPLPGLRAAGGPVTVRRGMERDRGAAGASGGSPDATGLARAASGGHLGSTADSTQSESDSAPPPDPPFLTEPMTCPVSLGPLSFAMARWLDHESEDSEADNTSVGESASSSPTPPPEAAPGVPGLPSYPAGAPTGAPTAPGEASTPGPTQCAAPQPQ